MDGANLSFAVVLAISVPIGIIAFCLYRLWRFGSVIPPWNEDADKRFGSPNWEPPIELHLNEYEAGAPPDQQSSRKSS